MTGEALPQDLAGVMELMEEARQHGFRFERIATGPDASVLGRRASVNYVDEVYLAGFGRDCTGIRRKRYNMIVPGGLLVTERVSGDARNVLLRVAEWRD
jgi:hypothetical protein